MKKIITRVLAAVCVLSLTGCSSLFGIATPPPPYPDDFMFVDGFGVDLSDPESIKAAYRRHMASLTGAEYIGNPAFSSNISEIVSARPEWSRNFQNFQIVDYDMEKSVLVYAYQTTLKKQEEDDYKVPDVEIAPIDYGADPKKKESPKVTTIKNHYSDTDKDKKLISAVGTYRWKDDKGKAVKESTIFYDTDTITNTAKVSELGLGNKNLIVKKIGTGELGICYNGQLLIYDYGQIPVDVIKNGKIQKETRWTYVPVVVGDDIHYTWYQNQNVLAYSLEGLKNYALFGMKEGAVSGTGQLKMYTSYWIDFVNIPLEAKKRDEKILYQLVDKYKNTLDEKQAFEEYHKTFRETYKVEQVNGHDYVTVYPNINNYMVKALQQYAALEENQQYRMTASISGCDKIEISMWVNERKYDISFSGDCDYIGDELRDGRTQTLTDIEIYRVKDSIEDRAESRYLVIAQYRFDKTEEKKPEVISPIVGEPSELEAESETSIDEKEAADSQAEYKVIAGITAKYDSIWNRRQSTYESNLQTVQVTNNTEMKQAFIEEQERIKKEIEQRKTSYETEIKTGSKVDVSEKNVEDLESILANWEQIVILQKKLESLLAEQGEREAATKAEKESKETSESKEVTVGQTDEELQAAIDKLEKEINEKYGDIAATPRSLKITYKEKVLLDPEKLSEVPNRLTDDAVTALKTMTEQYKRIWTSTMQIREATRLLGTAFGEAVTPFYDIALNQLALSLGANPSANDAEKKQQEIASQSLGELRTTFWKFPWEDENLSDSTYLLENNRTFKTWLVQEEKNLSQLDIYASKMTNEAVNTEDGDKHPYEDGFLAYWHAVQMMGAQLKTITEAYELLNQTRDSLEESSPMKLERFDQVTFEYQQTFLLNQCDKMQELIQQVNQGMTDDVISKAKKELSEIKWKISISPGIGDGSILKTEIETKSKRIVSSRWIYQDIIGRESSPIFMERISESRALTSNTKGYVNFLNLACADDGTEWRHDSEWAASDVGLMCGYIDSQDRYIGKDNYALNQLVSGLDSQGDAIVLASGENQNDQSILLRMRLRFQKNNKKHIGNIYYGNSDWIYGSYTPNTITVKTQEDKTTMLDIDKDKIYADTKANDTTQIDTDFLSRDHTVFLPDNRDKDNTYFLNISTQEGVVLYKISHKGNTVTKVYGITDNCYYNGAPMEGGYFRGWVQPREKGGYDLVVLGFCKEDTKTEINGVAQYRDVVMDDIYKAHLYKMNIGIPSRYAMGQ